MRVSGKITIRVNIIESLFHRVLFSLFGEAKPGTMEEEGSGRMSTGNLAIPLLVFVCVVLNKLFFLSDEKIFYLINGNYVIYLMGVCSYQGK